MENLIDAQSSSYSFLEQVTGTQWIGVKFLKYIATNRDKDNSIPMRFCEAVFRARRNQIDLVSETVCCEGAKRSFGWMKSRDQIISLELSEKTGLNINRAFQLLQQTPVLGYPYPGIRVGDRSNPDVLVTYVQPEAVMRLIRLWETVMGKCMRVEISSILAVCGNAVVKSYMNQSVSISFGCPDSRRYGGIEPDQLVVAIPTDLLKKMKDLVPDWDALSGDKTKVKI